MSFHSLCTVSAFFPHKEILSHRARLQGQGHFMHSSSACNAIIINYNYKYTTVMEVERNNIDNFANIVYDDHDQLDKINDQLNI